MSARSDLIFRLADEVIIACDLGSPKPRGARGTIAGACGDAYDAGVAAGIALAFTDADEGEVFVVSADETRPEDSHGLDIGTRVRLIGPPVKVCGASAPEPQWRQFEVLDGSEVGDWRNLDPRHVERT